MGSTGRPGPTPSGSSLLSAFNGTNPNGTWSLYIMDDTLTNVGNMAGGWELNISTDACPTPSPTPTATATFTPTPTATATATATADSYGDSNATADSYSYSDRNSYTNGDGDALSDGSNRDRVQRHLRRYSTSFTATLTSSGNPVVGKTITFTLNGNAVASGVTNGSGVATSGTVTLWGLHITPESIQLAPQPIGPGMSTITPAAEAIPLQLAKPLRHSPSPPTT